MPFTQIQIVFQLNLVHVISESVELFPACFMLFSCTGSFRPMWQIPVSGPSCLQCIILAFMIWAWDPVSAFLWIMAYEYHCNWGTVLFCWVQTLPTGKWTPINLSNAWHVIMWRNFMAFFQHDPQSHRDSDFKMHFHACLMHNHPVMNQFTVC